MKTVFIDPSPAATPLAGRMLLARLQSLKGQLRRVGSPGVGGRAPGMLDDLSADEIPALSVEGLAARLGCKPSELNRLFQRNFGLTLTAFRLEARLADALRLLREPRSKIADVAAQCGFNRPGLFKACFQRRFDATPGEWRKQNRSPVSAAEPKLRRLAA